MELNREQIEHTLEICSSGDEQCAYCCLLAFDGCARELAKLALALIRELTAENERLRQEWVSVDERLPEEDVRVLVCINSERSYTKMDTDRLKDGHFVRWYYDVTHWMPLPPEQKVENKNG